MANPKNRALVQEALQAELERDRTKTYVVEISPLGLVEMTRQNVTEGPREILTERCPTCSGDGIVLRPRPHLTIERRLRSLATGARAQAFRVDVNEQIAALLAGPTGERLVAIEEQLRERGSSSSRRADVPLDHFVVAKQGKRDDLLPKAPFTEGQEPVGTARGGGEGDVRRPSASIDGYNVTVAHAAKLVGKKVRIASNAIVARTAYAALVTPPPDAAPTPPTAESQAEKPTRGARKPARGGQG